MGSPLTLTIANCYMFFFERSIVNWSKRHLMKQVDRWNALDINIKLNADFGSSADFLDLHIENINGQTFTRVYHKPSCEPYYLPFNSVHPKHMKKNIPFAILLRMALSLNRYPDQFIDGQFHRLFQTLGIHHILTEDNYDQYRQKIIVGLIQPKPPINHGTSMFVHFTYYSNMRSFPKKFHELWQKYFDQSAINDIVPMLGTRNVLNLQRRLVHTRQ